MKPKKYITIHRILLCSLSLFLIALIGMTIIPIRIQKEITAIEIKLGDPTYIQNCTISIEGYYHISIVSDDSFAGTISISGYDLTSEKMNTVYISRDGFPLYYYCFDESICDIDGRPQKLEYSLGKLVSRNFFRDMIIAVYSDNPIDKATGWKVSGNWGTWNNQNGVCIVANAQTYTEGLVKVQTFLD